jgi:hypothetical protein
MATRRTFLRTLALLGAALYVRVPSVFAGTSRASARHSLAAKLIACVEAKKSAEIVGLEYLRAFPSEGNAEQLASLIGSGLSKPSQSLARASRKEIRSLLARQQRDDFAADRIVNVGGWVLSCSEARLYALVALSVAAR